LAEKNENSLSDSTVIEDRFTLMGNKEELLYYPQNNFETEKELMNLEVTFLPGTRFEGNA